MTSGMALALIAATAALVAIPGPNVALIVANTLRWGLRAGVATVLGTTAGVGLQLVVVTLGLGAVLAVAAGAFVWLKWAGVAYLLWLGLAAWRGGTAGDLGAVRPQAAPVARRFGQGLLLALVNPKTLLFNAAFLPQFVAAPAGPSSLVAPAALYLAVLCLGDLAWAGAARFARPALLRLGPLRNRLTGGLYLGAGVGLALARVER